MGCWTRQIGNLETLIEKCYEDKLSDKLTEERWRALNDKWEREVQSLKVRLYVGDPQNEQATATAQRVLELTQRLP